MANAIKDKSRDFAIRVINPAIKRAERPSSLRLSRATRRKPKGNFRNYKVWQDAVEYSVRIYQLTDKMPWFNCVDSCRDSTMLKRA